MSAAQLHKASIVIWSDYLTDQVVLDDLAREATTRDSAKRGSGVPQWDVTDFLSNSEVCNG